MDIHEATLRYETWLAEQVPILHEDLTAKHRKMRKEPFAFLRGTFYRWVQQWPEICGDLQSGPTVLAVGDLHVANFGTWRDREGRLIWGINDFDEACRLPVANDLVRLATSVRLTEGIKPRPRDAFRAILAGYRRSLELGGRPYVLAEHHRELRALALARLKEPQKYWRKLLRWDEVTEKIPSGAWNGIRRLMPARDLEVRVVHREAGLGSLGRERFTAIADWRGGKIAREAKALAPSASAWARGGTAPRRRPHQEILTRAVRCPDPFVRLQGRWIVRRLAPDCSRIEFDSVPDEQDQRQLLWAMGWETANVHLGSARARVLLRHLGRLPASWLAKASKRMTRAVVSDWEAFRDG